VQEILEAYIMPHVKFVRDTTLFNLSRGSIGWRILGVMKIHLTNQQGQVIWWGQRTKMIKDLMREHRSTGNRKIKMAVLKGKKYDGFFLSEHTQLYLIIIIYVLQTRAHEGFIQRK